MVQLCQTDDAELKRQVANSLQRLTTSDHKLVQFTAQYLIDMAPEEGSALLALDLALSSDETPSYFSATQENGVWEAVQANGDRKLRIREEAGGAILVEITELLPPREKKRRFEAKNLEELQAMDLAYRVYCRYGQAGKIRFVKNE